MAARVRTEEELANHKPVYLFGKDVTQIPCFRSSFICGICCGVAGGLACFLGTSKTLFSTHVAFASLWIGVFGYWIPCRYKYEITYLMVQDFKARVDKKFSRNAEKMNDDNKNDDKKNDE